MRQSDACIRIRLDADSEESAELAVYPAAEPCGRAVVLCPGGGFNRVAFEEEGEAFVSWFRERGMTCAVLCYRMPHGVAARPLEDVRAALDCMRGHAREWGSAVVGVLGASIGGHIAASAATLLGEEERPAFQILLYPVISMLDELAHRPSRGRMMGDEPDRALQERYSLERQVTAGVPPAFIVLAEDDPVVSPLHALHYYEALYTAGVPVSLHVYPQGGHSFAIRESFPYRDLWLAELDRFLKG